MSGTWKARTVELGRVISGFIRLDDEEISAGEALVEPAFRAHEGAAPPDARFDPVASLLKHSGSSEKVLLHWLEKLETGRLPYLGAWRTPEEIEALEQERRRRARILLFEVLGLLGALLLMDLVVLLVLVRGF